MFGFRLIKPFKYLKSDYVFVLSYTTILSSCIYNISKKEKYKEKIDEIYCILIY